MEGVLELLGLLPARLQADGISGVGARARRVLRERPAGSRQSFLGKPSPWEGGQHWSCGHGTCQAPGRASTSCRAPLQGISAAWKRSHLSFWLHGETADTAGWSGNPPPWTAAALCPPVSRGTGKGGQRGWKCKGTAWGDHIQLITLSKTPPSAPSFSALATCNRISALWFG